jgi:hypothetical protein
MEKERRAIEKKSFQIFSFEIVDKNIELEEK